MDKGEDTETMADIKQAARWMRKGKLTTRKGKSWVMGIAEGDPKEWFRIFWEGKPEEEHAPFDPDDILAKDWELVTK